MESEGFSTRYLSVHGGPEELEGMCDEVTELDLSDTESETESSVDGDEESETQLVQTELRLCRIKHCAGCSNLHLCKLHLFGECPYSNHSDECQFSHDLYSEHNVGVLCQHRLLELDCSELCIILLQNDTTLLPSVCLAYNEGSGEFGNCLGAGNCKKLHVCENYIRGICDSSTGCSRCHDLYEPQPLKILQDNGVSNQLMSILLSIYKNMLTIEDARTPGIQHSAVASEEVSDPEWICLFHFQNACNVENTCGNVHFYLPYKWEQWDGHCWKVLPDNEEVERAFCDPTKIHSDSSVPVHFDAMTQGSAEVRRLSTISSVLDPSFALTTTWIWYWEDECGHWIQYGSLQGPHNISSISSEFLEWKYQGNIKKNITFTIAEHSYRLSMQDMMQCNKQTGTKMRVRRRPMFRSAEDVQKITTRQMESKDHPENPQALSCDSDKANMSVTGFKRVLLNTDSDEYKKISEHFSQTMSKFHVKSIEKVLNEDLWQEFKRHIHVMKQKNVGTENEKLLFHGTESKQIDAICLQNIFCEPRETLFGKGSYFTRDAISCHSYTDKSGTQCMFLCRVYIGEYTNGHPSYNRPPQKHGGNNVFYDSCVNDVNIPSIFVVFEKHQVYPEYLIQYEQTGDTPRHVSLHQFTPASQDNLICPPVPTQRPPQNTFQRSQYSSTPYFGPLIAPNLFTPVMCPPFARPQNNFKAGRTQFRSYYRPPLFRHFHNPARPQILQGPYVPNIVAHARPSGSVIKAKPQGTRQQTHTPAGRLSPVNSLSGRSYDTKSSKSVKVHNAKHQGTNSARSSSRLSPGAVSAGAATNIDSSKSARNENARAKRVSGLSSRPRTRPDTESTKPAGKNPRSFETQSTKPAEKNPQSSETQSTKSAGISPRSSDTQSAKPKGKSPRSSDSQSTNQAGKSSRHSDTQSAKPACRSSKSSRRRH